MSESAEVRLVPGAPVPYARLAAWLEEASPEQLQAVYTRARDLHKGAWIAMAITCGVAANRTAEALTTEDLAATFDVSKMTVSRYARIYRLILKVRIATHGDACEFALWEEAYFLLACDAERHCKKPAHEVLEIAEDGNLSIGQFKRKLIEDGLLADPDAGVEVAFKAAGPLGKVMKAIVLLSDVEKEVADEALVKVSDVELDVGNRIASAIEFLEMLQSERDRALASFAGESKASA